MKKIFEMRKHRNRDREQDDRYDEELRDYEDYGDEDYPEDDEFYEDDEYSDEDYAEDDEDYPDDDEDYREDDEDYPEDEDYRDDDMDYPDDEDNRDYQEEEHYSDRDRDYHEDERVSADSNGGMKKEPAKVVAFARVDDNEEYPDEDYREDDEDYPEDKEDYREDDYSEDDDYPEDEDDYPEDDDDYPENEDDYPEDEDDYPEDEEDYPEDEEDYPEEDDYPEDDYPRDDYRNNRSSRRDDRDRDSVGARILAFISNTTAVERIAVGFALLILIGGIATASFYMNAKKGTQQIASFTEIGTNLQGIDLIGQSGLIAVADAEKARAMAADLVVTDEFTEEEEVEEVVADDAEDVTIQMTVTSIKSDLKVKFINSKTGKLVANLPLEIDVVNPDGSNVTYNDHDQDGIIYKKDLTAGEYKVTPKALGAGYESYKLELSSKSVTVKDTVEMKVVDVANEIKKESQVNAAQEDTAVKDKVESTLTDTVEYVESNKVAVGESSDGKFVYESINKDEIVDPSSSSRIGFAKYMLLWTSAGTGASDSADGASNDNAQTETPEETGNTETPSNQEEQPKEPEKKTMQVSPSDYTVYVGETVSINLSGPDSPTYESRDTGIATVSGNGTVTGVAKGTVEIVIRADNYEDGKAYVTVKEKEPTSKDFNVYSNLDLKVGETKKLSDSLPPSYQFSGYDSSKVVLSNDGSVTAVSAGHTEIVVSAEGFNEKKVSVNITGEINIKKEYTVKVGDKVKIEGTLPFGCTYESRDNNIATAEGGVITGVTAGQSTIIRISAEYYNPVEISVTVTAQDVTKVPMAYSKLTLVEGRTFTVKSKQEGLAISLDSDNSGIANVSGNTITAIAAGNTFVTVSADKYEKATIEITVVGKNSALKDKNGNVVYVKKDGVYVEATLEDYYNYSEFFLKKGATAYKYTGWQTIENKTYFFKKDGNYVTGEQVIKGVKYVFNSEGVLQSSTGIDVSKWNGRIDWEKVRNSGVSFVIIRCGYRGSSQGALIEDPQFRSNIKGALNAGLRVGVYFFTQAVNEVEAVEEASMVINLVKGYNISMPIYLDVESSGGRADKINAGQRTANIRAFCGTIANAGYTAGVYANKTWFSQMINVSQLTNYKIWLAQYAASVTYNASRYDMWQCTSKGSVPGITGNVDMNICY